MAEKFSPDTLLEVAVQLFLATHKNHIERIATVPIEERRARTIDEFVKFYRQLRDKLEADES